jgi:hypothetical protein
MTTDWYPIERRFKLEVTLDDAAKEIASARRPFHRIGFKANKKESESPRELGQGRDRVIQTFIMLD